MVVAPVVNRCIRLYVEDLEKFLEFEITISYVLMKLQLVIVFFTVV